MHRSPTLALALALAATATSQTIVSGGGSALQNAINTAAPGDTLIVRAGTYDDLTTQIGVRVVCDPGVIIQRFDASVIEIQNLPAGQTFVLRGATLVPSHPLTTSAYVNACNGIVIFEDIQNATTFTVQDCAQVSFHDVECTITNLRSNVACVDSDVSISGNGRASISGGSLGVVWMTSTETWLTGDADVAFLQIDGGTLRVDPDVQLPAAPNYVNGATVITQEIPSLSAGPFVPGTTVTLDLQVGAGQVGAIAIGFPSPVIPSPIGDFWGGNFMIGLLFGVAPANGEMSTTFAVPAGWNAGESFVLHGILGDAFGAIVLSPALVTVVP